MLKGCIKIKHILIGFGIIGLVVKTVDAAYFWWLNLYKVEYYRNLFGFEAVSYWDYLSYPFMDDHSSRGLIFFLTTMWIVSFTSVYVLIKLYESEIMNTCVIKKVK